MENKQYKFPMFFTFDWVLNYYVTQNEGTYDEIIEDFRKAYLQGEMSILTEEGSWPYEYRTLTNRDKKLDEYFHYGIRLPFEATPYKRSCTIEIDGEIEDCLMQIHDFIEPQNQETEDKLFWKKLSEIYDRDRNKYSNNTTIKLTDFLDFQYKAFEGEANEYLEHFEKVIVNFTVNTPKGISLQNELKEWQKRELQNATLIPPKEVEERVKLRFRNNKGDKKALYYVLQQLSVREILPNKDNIHLARFLIDNVEGFESNDLQNLARELSRRDYEEPPKKKNKIDIPD